MIKQYKELVATDLYIVAIYDNKSIDVYDRYENAKGALRQIADENNFKYDESWNTRQFGKKIIDALGGGAPAIADETYCVYTVAAKYKIKYDEAWNTQQFGKKVIEALR